MSHQDITGEFVKSCLFTTADYKNTKIFKQAVSEGQEQYYVTICEAIHEILVNKGYPPMAKLLAIRLSKELIDLFNMTFVKVYEDNVLFALREFAIYQCPSTDPNRGNTFFGENSEKDIKQIGVSLVRLSLDCIKAWAMFFPCSETGEMRKFYSFYSDLIQQKVNFPPWAYYKQEFVDKNESPYFKSVDLMATQKIGQSQQPPQHQPIPVAKNSMLDSNPQIKVVSKPPEKSGFSQIHQTPNPTPADPKEKVVIKAKQVLKICANLQEETGDICSHTLAYQHGDFDHIRDEAMAKHEEMDLLVNDLIDVDEEDLAAEAMIEMDNLKALSEDINNLIASPTSLWKQFRSKYMQNRQDFAQQQQEHEMREKQRLMALEQQRIEEELKQQFEEQIKRQKVEEEQRRQQREREQKEQERLAQIQEAERQKREHEQQERERKLREMQEQQRKEEQQRQERERQEKERLEKERQEKERLEKERIEKERLEKERIENERRMNELKHQQEKEKAMRELQFQQEQKKKQENEEQEKRIKEQEEFDRLQQQQLISLIKTDQQPIEGQLQLKSNILSQQQNQDSEQHKNQILGARPLSYEQNQESEQLKIQQLIGESKYMQSNQFQQPQDSRIANSMLGRSNIQNRQIKPVSHSSQGKRQQPVALKVIGDVNGAPDVIVENPNPQKNSQQDFYSSQVSVLTDQLRVLQEENQRLRKQLEDEEKINAQLKLSLLQMPQSNVLSTEYVQQLENQRIQIDKQMKEIHNLQSEKMDLEKKTKDLQKALNDQQTNTEAMRMSLKDSHEQDLKAHSVQGQQLYQEKQALLSQIDMLKKRLEGNTQQEQNIFQLQQQISQQQREIQELKRQKDQQIINNQKDNELKQHEISEQQQLIDTLQKQIDIYKQQVDKGMKDYALLQEKQKESLEQAQGQIYEARKQGLTTQSELNQVKLKLSDKEEEYKQLNLVYKQVVNEKNSLQQKYEQEQQQSNQILQMYQNGDSKNTTLLQSKLKQTLDEMDKMREIHRTELKDKDNFYQTRINELAEEKQVLQSELKQLQDAALKAAQQAAQQAALNAQQTPKMLQSPYQERKTFSKPNSQNVSQSGQISVNVGQKAMEVNSQLPEMILQQPICPLPSFKHFPSNCLFNLPKIQEKGKMITAECLELIFPYQDPADYFQNRQKKNRKGKVIQSSSVSHEIAHLDTQNRNLFKQRCLGSQGLIYLDNDFQFGLSFQIQHYQGRPYYTYGLYVYNVNQRQDGFFLQFLEVDQFSSFWANPIELRKPLYESSQELVEILVSVTKSPFQLLTVQVGHSTTHPYQFYIPNHICQSIVYKDIRLSEFRNKWASNIQNQMRTELLLLNKAVFGSVQQLQHLIPRLLVYNSHKMNDYEMGIDEIKLVGLGNYFELQFLIKFEILPDDKICIYLTFDSKLNSKRYLLEQILQGYAFILGNGKSQ